MKRVTFLLFCMFFILVAGCLGVRQPYPDITMYSIHLERESSQAKEEGALALKMKKFYVSPRFESKSLVYKTSNHVYETDYYNRFIIPPSTMITEQVSQWLTSSPKIRYLADSRFTREVDYTLEGRVLELYGDFRNKENPVAVLTVEMVLLDEEESPPKAIIQEIYNEEIVLDGPSVSTIIAAFNQGLKSIMIDFEADLNTIE